MFRSCALIFLVLDFMASGPGFSQSPENPSQDAGQLTVSGDTIKLAHPGPKEDWTKLKVDRSVMPMLLAGFQLAKYETPKFTREEIRLQWRRADPVDIWVVMPRGVEKPRVALYLYSFPSDIDRFRDDSWCQGATEKGLAAVGFISALTGERFRGRPLKEWFVPSLQESMGSSVHDVQLIIDYLARRGDLNVDGIGMFGQGSGGAIAILAAAADPRIRAIDLLNPWGDWPDWLKSSPVVPDAERANLLTQEFLQKVSYVEPITYLPALKDRALRVQQILDYPNTPPEARDKIAAAVPAGDLVQYKNRAAHAEAWKTSGLSGWLADQLGSKTPAAGTAGK
jgi:pimeloyl-ACP methyl ester carboxylesterase